MYTYTTERLIAAQPSRLPAAIDDLVERLWGGRARRVDDEPLLMYAVESVEGIGGPDVWLSFLVFPTGRACRVRVTLDELERGPDPTDGLDEVLDLLAADVELARR